MVSISAAQINAFKREVDSKRKGGNGNGIVDGSEIELFNKKCKTAGLDNIEEIMEDYNENRTQREAEFEERKTNPKSSVEAAVIAALTEDTVLRRNEQAENSAKSVKEGIKNSDNNTNNARGISAGAASGAAVGACVGGGIGAAIGAVAGALIGWLGENTNTNGDAELMDPDTWFNNEEEILESAKFITSSNAVEVLSDKEVVEKIEDADPEVRAQVVNHSVEALIKAANEAQVDVSDIVFEEDGTFKTGRALKAEYGSPVEENFSEVVTALSKKVKKAQDALNGKGSKEVLLTIAAKKIDDSANGNGNGYIDKEEEVVEFKQFAAEHGIDVDTILEQIRDNEANGVENTTDAQKIIYNIFDPEQKAARDAAFAAEDADVARAMADGIGEGNNDAFSYAWPSEVATFFSKLFEGDSVDWQDGNKELLDKTIGKVNSDNVMTVLNKNPKLVDKIMNKYSHNWFMNLFADDKFEAYTTPILTALVQHAQENGIDVSDIVMVDENGNMMTGANSGVRAGKDATGEDYAQSVIAKLQERINAEEKNS